MELIAQKRTELGKKSKKLRKERKLPAVVFGKGMDSVALTLDAIQFDKIYDQAGESSLVNLKLSGEPEVKILISSVDVDPVTDKIVHANLHKVNLKEKIHATVPLEFVGESPIVKAGEGLLLTLLQEVTVEALPSDLPHDIKIDISSLTELEQGLHIKDLPIDHSKVEIVDHEQDDLIVKIDHPQMKEEEPEVVPVSEAELIAQVAVTEQLTDEEKAAREAAKKEEEKE